MKKAQEIIIELGKKNDGYQELSEKYDELFNEQEEKLSNLVSESEVIARWYRDNKFVFTHPTIRYRSNRGPILGFDDDELIIWVLDKGFIRYNIHSKEEKGTNLYWLMTNDHFDDAVAGILYLEDMLDAYTEKMARAITTLENGLKALE